MAVVLNAEPDDSFLGALSSHAPGVLNAAATRRHQSKEAEKTRAHQLLLEDKKQQREKADENKKLKQEEAQKKLHDQQLNDLEKYIGKEATDLIKLLPYKSEAQSKTLQTAIESVGLQKNFSDLLRENMQKNPEEMAPVINEIKSILQNRSAGGRVGQPPEQPTMQSVQKQPEQAPQEDEFAEFRFKPPERMLGETRAKHAERVAKEEQAFKERHQKGSDKVLEETYELSKSIPKRRADVAILKKTVGDVGGFDWDYMADLFHNNALRTPSGVLFRSAIKDIFIEGLSGAGSRPNQWIEQKISSALPEIGNTPQGNEMILAMTDYKLDLDEEKIRLTQEMADKYKKELGFVPDSIGRQVEDKLRLYADKKQDGLMFEIQEISEKGKTPQELVNQKVTPGTFLTPKTAQAFLKKHNGDLEKAEEEAIKKGYIIPSEEMLMKGK